MDEIVSDDEIRLWRVREGEEMKSAVRMKSIKMDEIVFDDEIRLWRVRKARK